MCADVRRRVVGGVSYSADGSTDRESDLARTGRFNAWIIAIPLGVFVGTLIAIWWFDLDTDEVQVFSSMLIAGLTSALVIATIQYVRSTELLAAEAKRTNDLATDATVRTLRLTAPSLDVTATGSRSLRDDEVRGILEIRNLGEGIAYRVQIRTDWGEGEFPRPIGKGETVQVDARIPRSQWRDGSNPVVLESRFTDAGGSIWRQEPGRLPQLA